MHTVLAPNLSVGPTWLPLAVVSVFVAAGWFAYSIDRQRPAQVLGHATSASLTFFMLASVLLLVFNVVHKQEAPVDLLRSASALWVTNVIVFASWYWRLDAGGPHGRDQTIGHDKGSFLFPQMSLMDEKLAAMGYRAWSPGFIDYLFLAFNTSTALSPADTPALSRWSKLLMMTQALISLTVIVLLAARAVNML